MSSPFYCLLSNTESTLVVLIWAAQVTAWPCKKYKGGTVMGNPQYEEKPNMGPLFFPRLFSAGSQMINLQGAYIAAYVDYSWVPCVFANWRIAF